MAADPPVAGPAQEKDKAEVLAGHSMHGETFNEGPRQAAYLMEGMGNIQFDVSTSHGEAKKFFRQGVAQLHGFWYYEAERSFRQAAALDPNCAMCYWGMALANVNNRKRAESFIEEAVKRRDGASDREKMYIDAAKKRFSEKADGKKPSKKEIAEAYSRDLEDIVLKYPEDIEAKALLALQLWENERNDSPIVAMSPSIRFCRRYSTRILCIRLTTIASTCGTNASHRRPSRARPCADRACPALLTCGTCPAIPIPTCIAIKMPCGNKKPQPASITHT